MLRITCSALFLAAAIYGVSYAGNETVNEPAAPAAAPANAPAATPAREGGAVSGTITFGGQEVSGEEVDLSPDAYCVEHHSGGPYVIGEVKSGPLKDVFVQLDGVPDEKYEAPDSPVVLDQIRCSYEPHVFGVMKKQDIEIRNSDETLHNIHPTPESNKEFNLAMPNKGDVRSKSFRKAEDAIPFKCDVHPWMNAYCFVMDHPYFAVTDENGAFAIDTTGLPDGEYKVKVWHEVLGEKDGTVTVAEGAATYDFDFDG
jgi:hypothetical protein